MCPSLELELMKCGSVQWPVTAHLAPLLPSMQCGQLDFWELTASERNLFLNLRGSLV